MIFVDTKTKELTGDYNNGDSNYGAIGCADEVNVHDFLDMDLGKIAPYGIYDITANDGWAKLERDRAERNVQSM